MNEVKEIFYVAKMSNGEFLYMDYGSAEMDPRLSTIENFNDATRFEEKNAGLDAARYFEDKRNDMYKFGCDRNAKFDKFMKIKVVNTLEEDVEEENEIKDMTHAKLYLYKGKESNCIVKKDPYLNLRVTVSHRENGRAIVKFCENQYEGNNQYKTGEERFCTVEEFKQILRDEYKYEIGGVFDNGDVDENGYLIRLNAE